MLTILSLKRACMSDKQLLTFSDHSERCGRGVGMQQVTAQFHVYSQPLAPPLSLHVARGRCKSSQALNPAGQRQMRHKFPSTPQRRLRPASRMQYVEQPSVSTTPRRARPKALSDARDRFSATQEARNGVSVCRQTSNCRKMFK